MCPPKKLREHLHALPAPPPPPVAVHASQSWETVRDSLRRQMGPSAAAPRSIAVVVLGDVGRSPRMQYHTASLASLPRTRVSLVGYAGERCIASVEGSERVTQFLLGSPFARLPRSLFLLWAPLKVLYQVLQLFWTLLLAIPRPDVILVQNPPR